MSSDFATVLAYPADVELVVALKTVRDATARAHFLAGVREYGKDGAEFTLERLQYLMAIEEHFHALLLYDQIDYLREPPPISEADREFALSIQRICLEAANGFQRFLRNRNAWATSRENLDTMFRATGLALNAIHSFVKWGYFLNEPGRAAPWKQLHALYLLADHDSYAQVPFVLHPTQPSFKPSVQSLYLRTLLLDLLNTGNLSKIQIEIADGWFSSWCNDYSLDTEYSSRQHLFYVDVASDSGMHLMRKDSHGETVRYMRVDSLKAQIEEVQAGLRHGRLYAGYGAGAVFPVEQHVALLAIIEKLYQSIIAGSENRIEERTHFEDREVDVSVGVERVMRKVREAPTIPEASPAPAFSLPASDTIELSPAGLSLVEPGAGASDSPASAPSDPEVERWRVHDLSSKGYGLIVDRASSDAVLLNGSSPCRTTRPAAGSSAAWCASSPTACAARCWSASRCSRTVRSRSSSRRAPADPRPRRSTSRGRTPTASRTRSWCARANSARRTATSVRTAGSEYRIRLNRIIKKGADWIKARFEIEAKQS
jgi:hypothetical protein